MGKFVGWVLVAMACGGVALAAGGGKAGDKFTYWDAVESLAPGTEVNVLSGNQAGPDLCLVSAVDANTLTCLAEYSANDVRLIFPRDSVRDVWVIEPWRDRHIGLWLGIALGFFLGGAMCAELGPGAFFLCGAIGASIVVSAVTTGPGPLWLGYPGLRSMPRPPRMRRRLVYRMP
jgi:hypothetical protein